MFQNTDGFGLAGTSRALTRRYHHQRHRHTQSTLHSSASGDESESAPTTSIDATTKVEIRNIANHIASQHLDSLLSKSDALAISNELFFSDSQTNSSPIFNDNSYEQYVKYWNKVEKRLREETDRSPADLLGKELTSRILSSIRGDDPKDKRRGGGGRSSGSRYDAQTVRTFLESDAINSLFTKLLYDAIFEFTTKFDILGNAISNLPLLGPVRNQVLKESKKNMDRTLGPLLQRFLSGYTRVAIRQAVDFVVSDENASAFGKVSLYGRYGAKYALVLQTDVLSSLFNEGKR